MVARKFKMDNIFQRLKIPLFGTFLFLGLTSFLIPWWLLCHLCKWVVIIIARFCHPDFASVLSPSDNLWTTEDSQKPPKSSIICTLTLDGDISLNEFSKQFKSNVLEASLPSTSSPAQTRPRYPELKQYHVDFLGYTFWKKNPNFKIENHIFEEKNSSHHQLRSIHQEMLDKLYTPKQSPWDITLIRNYNDGESSLTKNSRKTLIIARFHHSMTDAKSIIKLFVECLGNQQLTTAKPQEKDKSLMKELLFYATFPVQFIHQFGIKIAKSAVELDHPWRANVFDDETKNNSQVVGLSPQLLLEDIKLIAKKYGVTTSSVIVAIICGAAANLDERLKRKSMFVGYALPKPEHPKTLGNHAYLGMLRLPTNESSIKKRLQKCDEEFINLKSSEEGRYMNFVTVQAGVFIKPVGKLFIRNALNTVGITNIAGESKGFSVAGRNVSEFIFSVGTLPGCTGAVFCASSYKNVLRITVIAKNSIFDDVEVQKLANAIGIELETLKTLKTTTT